MKKLMFFALGFVIFLAAPLFVRPYQSDESLKGDQYEAEIHQIFDQQIAVSELSPEQRATVDELIQTGEEFEIPTIEVAVDEELGFNLSAFASQAVFYAPAVAMDPAIVRNMTAGMTPLIKNGQMVFDYAFFTVNHWPNHLSPQFGLPYYNIGAYGEFARKVVAASNDVFFHAGQNRFMFLGQGARVGAESALRPVVVLIDASGAPVSAYDYGLRHSVASLTEESKFVTRMTARGWVRIGLDQVPETIRKAWLEGSRPSNIRLVWWGLAYQIELHARMAGISLLQAAGTYGSTMVNPMLFIVAPLSEGCQFPGDPYCSGQQ